MIEKPNTNLVQVVSVEKDHSVKIVYRDKETQLSEHFKLKEFMCRGVKDFVILNKAMVEIAEKLRKWTGEPIRINSAYRSPSYNKGIGGYQFSRHISGEAIDINIPPTNIKDKEAFLQYCWKIGVKEVGFYNKSRFIHIGLVSTGADKRVFQGN